MPIKQNDLEKLSIDELENTAALIETTIKTKRAAAVEQMKATVAKQCEALGIDLSDVFRKARKPAVVKYKDNEGNIWTGRGRTPNWLKGLDEKARSKYLVK